MPDLERPRVPRKKFKPYRIYTADELKIMHRKKIRRLASFFAFVAIVASLVGYLYYNSFFEKTRQAQIVTRSSLLVARVGGRIEQILIAEGQAIRAGEPLIEMDSQVYKKEFDEREAEMRRSENRIIGGRVYLGRLQEKAALGGEPERIQYENARAWLGRLESKAASLRTQVTEAKRKLDSTIIRAPSDGHTGKILVSKDNVVSVGSPLVEFVGADLPWVIAKFRQDQLASIQIGQKAEIKVPNLHRTYLGKVASQAPMREPPLEKSFLEKFFKRIMTAETRSEIRIDFDPKSIGSDANRLLNETPVEAKVFK